jgi:hypothetical protein
MKFDYRVAQLSNCNWTSQRLTRLRLKLTIFEQFERLKMKND